VFPSNPGENGVLAQRVRVFRSILVVMVLALWLGVVRQAHAVMAVVNTFTTSYSFSHTIREVTSPVCGAPGVTETVDARTRTVSMVDTLGPEILIIGDNPSHTFVIPAGELNHHTHTQDDDIITRTTTLACPSTASAPTLPPIGGVSIAIGSRFLPGGGEPSTNLRPRRGRTTPGTRRTPRRATRPNQPEIAGRNPCPAPVGRGRLVTPM
jgi:hypothetical protein